MELGRDSDTGGQVIINQQIISNLINKYIIYICVCVCIFR